MVMFARVQLISEPARHVAMVAAAMLCIQGCIAVPAADDARRTYLVQHFMFATRM